MRGEFRVNSGAWNMPAVETATLGHDDQVPGRRAARWASAAPPAPPPKPMNRVRKLAHPSPAAGPRAASSARLRPVFQSRFSTRSTVAASELPPPRPPPDGNTFAEPDSRTQAHPGRRTAGPAPRARAGPRSGAISAGPCDALDAPVGGDLDLELIAPVEQLKEGLQIVVSHRCGARSRAETD